MTAIINATLVMRDHLIPDGILMMEDGVIVQLGDQRNVTVPEGCQIIDAEGLYVGPGLIDIHAHNGGQPAFTEDPTYACRVHMENGTTTVFPAIYFKHDQSAYLQHIATIRNAMQDPACANIGGIYMEGPYMNPKFGANRDKNPWKDPICREDYLPVIEAAGDLARVWVTAPEREHMEQFVRDAKRVNPNVRFAVGHSEASPQQIEALMPYGLCIGTHHTNATGDRPMYPECRGVCVDEAVNYNREIYAEMICDSRGIHVDPYMQRLIRKIKGEDRLILISDCSSDTGETPPGYEGVTDIAFDPTGEISGFCGTVSTACRNMMVHTGASIVDVFRYASYNPARATGLTDRGELREGLRADLVFADHWMNIKKVILKGEVKV